MATETAER